MSRVCRRRNSPWRRGRATPTEFVLSFVRSCFLGTILIFTSFTAMSHTNEPSKKTPADVMREIRLKVLTTPPSQMGRKPSVEYPHVDAMLMDWPIETTTVSVMASSVCDGSVYTTGTFGVFGGIGHENVRDAANNFVKLGEKYYVEAISTKEYPYPKRGRVRFYFVCYDEVRMLDADAASLASRKDKYSELYMQAQRVISELRQIVEKQKNETL